MSSISRNRSSAKLTGQITVPGISHFSILWSGVNLTPWVYLCAVTNKGQARSIASKCSDGDSPLSVEVFRKTGEGSEESFLSNILVSTSSFVGDDGVLPKNVPLLSSFL